MFFRGGEYVNRMHVQKSESLLISQFLQPMTMVIFMCSSILKCRYRSTKWITGIAFLLTNFPTGMSRNAVAAMYIPVLLWYIPLFRKKHAFVLSLIIGLLVIFPFLDNFRNYSAGNSLNVIFDTQQFQTMHFDAYSMFMRVIHNHIITDGRQLLGVLLFFVPRSMWPGKPVGSGAFVADQMHLSFDNVSMPLFGEGYVNFGFIGSIAFVVIAAVVSKKMDVKYWRETIYQARSLDTIPYFIVLGMFMFILRGDLMSSMAYTCGYLASYYFVKFFVRH